MISLLLTIALSTAPTPAECPPGTVVALPNDNGTVTCYSEADLEKRPFEPNDPPERTGGSGTR